MQADDTFVLLRRHSHKASGDAWGLPAGKVEPGENLKDAVLREVAEETGVSLSPDNIQHVGSYFVRDGTFDFEWHVFSATLDTKPDIVIHPHEHSEFKWVTPTEALGMNLIHDLPESIEIFYGLPHEK